ncbi:helix-turn-helix transcriptional regulator [Ornithinibacillus gellani]|uniref:helix-turn-helix domain-containing protein n=1 Tax=Ornithinibacillus gellani TaxID=2293253 RepID=UPI000F45F26F|nr:helix-turn-helix transcriptional regulator [Ornithinibacillus gellani]TQS71125.1 helix-turn-helix transcriptional regulator [Ornithinibacillus gellani]
MEGLGKKLEQLREESGLNQKEVSAKLGYSKNVFGTYEREERTPSIETLIHIADFFSVSIDSMVRGIATNKSMVAKEPPYHPLHELQRIFNDHNIKDPYILEIEKWSELTTEDLHDLQKHFEYVVYRRRQEKEA